MANSQDYYTNLSFVIEWFTASNYQWFSDGNVKIA